MTSAFIGTRPLLRVSVKQDARNIVPWVVLISVPAATLGADPALSLVFGPMRSAHHGPGGGGERRVDTGDLAARRDPTEDLEHPQRGRMR